MEPETTWLSGGFPAALEVAIVTAAGLIAVLFFYPVLVMSKAVKIPLKAWRSQASLRPSSSQTTPPSN